MEASVDEARLDQADLRYLFGLPQDNASSTVFRWLTGRDVRRSKLATNVLAKIGHAATDLLLSEALAPRKSPQQRMRLLAAIEQIGNPLDSQQWIRLVSEARRFEGAVLGQIMRLVVWNRQRTIDVRASSDSPSVTMPNPFSSSQPSSL